MNSAFVGAGGALVGARRIAMVSSLVVAALAGCGGGEDLGPEPYVRAQAGAYIDYDRTSGSGTDTCRIGVSATSGTLLFQSAVYSSSPTQRTQSWFLRAGDSLSGAATMTCTVDGSSCSSVSSYAPPFLALPASTTPGYSETTISTVTSGSSYASTRTVTVDGVESVTVPAGTFTALKITARIQVSGTDTYNVAWWVRGIGRVKIANYPALDQPPSSTWLMTAYGVESLPAADPVPVSLALDAGQGITATIAATGTLPTQTITGVATGDLAALSGATIFVLIEDPSALVASSSISAAPDGTFALTLQGRPLPSPGRVIGILKLHAFLDSGGRRPFGGSPLLLPYDVTVLP